MTARYFVYSTLSSDQKYMAWKPADKEAPHSEPLAHVMVRGGTNVANKHFITPHGMVTEVTEDQYQLLLQNDVFKRHVQNGFIQVREEKVDPEVAASSGMQQTDDSAPITPNDPRLQQEGGVKVLEEKPNVFERLKGVVGL